MNEAPISFEKPRGVARRFALVFSAALLLLVATGAAHFLIRERTGRIEVETRERLNLGLGKGAIDRGLQDVISDLAFLARHNENSDLFSDDNEAARRALAEQFRVFSRQKGKYDQIRVLDETGHEVVRVNYNGGEPFATAEAELQNKSERYYFTETWALRDRDVYISPFDLNIEHGHIERPEVPMIRFGTLMLGTRGNKRGVLLLNYLGSSLIDDFKEATANIADHVMLLNSDGFWLSDPGDRTEWGFMYGLDDTLAKRVPGVWQRIKAEESGQFYASEGLFTFATIHPVSDSAARVPYYWKAVSQVAPRRFTASLSGFLRQTLPLYVTMFALLAAGSFLVALTRFHHRQVVTEFESERRFRELLERRVEERTHALRRTEEEKNLVVQRLIQAEKMTAVGTMASGIGHEINNPLYAILGLAEAIRDDDEADQARGHADKILGYTRQIGGIVKNLTGYAQPFRDDDHESADVNESIREAVSMVERTLLDDRIEIRTDLADLPTIAAYAEEINQVLFNVVRNGVQSVDGTGIIEISSHYDGERITLRVTDSGEGIAPENLGKVFDPFFTTKEPDQGEGLGLYVVHQIIQKYNGSISVKSEVGEGTTCVIEFPAMPPEEKA